MTNQKYGWSTTPIDNSSVGNINWSENQPPSSVNGSARQEMADAAAFRSDTTGVILSTGTNNNYAVVVSTEVESYFAGLTVVFRSHLRNTGASTLSVTSPLVALGTQPLRAIAGQELGAGDIQAGQVIIAYHDGTQFLVANPKAGTTTIDNLDPNTRGLLAEVGDVKKWYSDTIPDGWFICDGQEIPRSTGSGTLFALWGTTFGVGNGSTTFNLVDLRGQFDRGLDTTAAFDPDSASRLDPNKSGSPAGAVIGSRQRHATEDHEHIDDLTDPQIGAGAGGGITKQRSGNAITSGIASSASPVPGSVDPVNISSETRSTNVACHWIVLADAAAAGAESTYVAGLSGFRFTYDGTSQDTTLDPGVGRFRLDTTSLDTFTEIALDDQTADEGNADIRSVIDTWGLTAGTDKGTLKLSRSAGPEIFVQCSLTATNGQTGFTRLTVPGAGLKDGFNGIFADGESVSFDFIPATPGVQGDPGLAGIDAGQPWDFSSNTDTTLDPGAGNFRINAGRTELAINGMTSEGADVVAWVRTWDDSTNTGNKGQLDIKLRSDPGDNFQQLRITGPITQDNTTWIRFPVADVVAPVGTIADTNNCSVQFARAGDEGGSTGGEANTSSTVGAGVGLTLPKSGVNLPFRSLQAIPVGANASAITVAQSGGGDEVNIGFQINALPTSTVVEADTLVVQRDSGGAIEHNTLKGVFDLLRNTVNRWTAAQTKEVTEVATWTAGWDAAESQDFNITATVTGAAGNFPVPTSAHLVNGTAQTGEITMTMAAGNTAGFAAAWQFPGGTAPDISAAGDYTLYYRIWRDSGGTTVNRLVGISPWATA